jgi:hypothetical protein
VWERRAWSYTLASADEFPLEHARQLAGEVVGVGEVQAAGLADADCLAGPSGPRCARPRCAQANSHRVRSCRTRVGGASPRAAVASSDCRIWIRRVGRAGYSLASMASIASMAVFAV